jgi:hypothetical protein
MIPKKIYRYGIAEWYGTPITSLSPEGRQQLGLMARLDSEKGSKKVEAQQPCRFAGRLSRNASCNKPGGVCSIMPYTLNPDDRKVETVDSYVVTCPRRFLEEGSLLEWVASTMLGHADVKLLGEVPFLRSASADDADSDSKSGRIDWLVVDNRSDALAMVALETQALYFSGHRMTDDFERYEESEKLIYPARHRRPDYRSGGPKRLAPQLFVKVPLLRNWGVKTAVLVDRYFHSKMATLVETPGATFGDKVDASDIVWFIADFANGKLVPGDVKCASLEDSLKALNATKPMSKTEFQAGVSRSLTRSSFDLVSEPKVQDLPAAPLF